MDFNEIKKEAKTVNFDALRVDNDHYFEGVLVKEEVEKLKERLNKFFGEPVFPSSQKLTSQAEQAIRDFGGVRRGQTLYFQNDKDAAFFAMLWPWEDGQHTTLKIARR